MLRPVLALLLLLAPVACTDHSEDADIVVTTNILGDITRNVVGDAATVTVLMPPGADPHQFALSAQQAAELDRAAVIVSNGLGLEEGLQRHIDAAEAEGVPTLAVGAEVDPIDYGETASGPDPHFWTDPTRVRTAAEVISRQVIEHVDGIDSGRVEANTANYVSELDELDTSMSEKFAELAPEQRKLVTDHHVFGYLAARYDFEVIGAVIPGGTTLASPSAADLADLAAAIRTAGVGAIFADASQPDRLAQVLAEQTGLEVQVIGLHSESLSEPGGGAGTYLEMMRTNTDAVVRGLAAP